MHATPDENHHPCLQVYSWRVTVHNNFHLKVDKSIMSNTLIRTIKKESDFGECLNFS